MSVEALPELRVHPTEEVLEEYCLGRLREPMAARLDEHLLLCPECCARAADLDQYLDVIKAGLREVAAESQPRTPSTVIPPLAFPFLSVSSAPILRIAALVVFVMSATVVWRAQHIFSNGNPSSGNPSGGNSSAQPESVVSLVAMRGGLDELPHTQAGIPLLLRIQRRSLPESSGYRIELAGAEGQTAWVGPAVIDGGNLTARVSSKLSPGLYWVRLYAGNETQARGLLREFGLRLE